MASELHLEHQCPQCGAPVILTETARLFACPYCRVRSFLHYRRALRCYLPAAAGGNGDLVLVPYWRFRGLSYTVAVDQVTWRVLDQSVLACKDSGMPPSLGFRPQAMTLRVVEPQTEGAFLPPVLQRKDFLTQLAHGFEQRVAAEGELPFHHAFVGESVQLIYAPYRVDRGRVRDAVSGADLPGASASAWGASARPAAAMGNSIAFLPTLCPYCGWDLEGEKDALMLFCGHCKRAWQAGAGGLEAVALTAMAQAKTADSADFWLPFWSLEATAAGLGLASYGDFVRLTNQSRVPSSLTAQRPFRFLVPAFKLNPKLFLHLGGWLTLRQPQAEAIAELPAGAIQSVNLAPAEAFQIVLTLLAHLTVARKKLLPKLQGVRFACASQRLVLVPFSLEGIEYVQTDLGFSLPASALNWGRHL